MKNRIDSPARSIPGALQALQGLAEATKQTDIPETTLQLVHLRASQINGCGVCVDMHTRELENLGETSARILTVAAWRDVSYFSGLNVATSQISGEWISKWITPSHQTRRAA